MLRRWLHRIGRAIVVTAVVGLLALWLDHELATELPSPTGPFAIGRTSQAWDDERAWLWYPAARAAPAAEYLPVAVRTEWERARPAFINFLTRDLSKVRAHGARDVEVSRAEPNYPVVILRAGGTGSALNFSSLAEDLVSHGYVVVGLDLKAAGNPELCVGRNDEEDCATQIMTPLIAAIGRAVDRLRSINQSDPRLAGTLDLTRVGVLGHSFGGAQALQFCSQDARCAAGIDLDGRPFGNVVRTGIRVPFMFLLSDHLNADDEVSRRILGQIQSIYERQPQDTRLRIAIRGAHHFTFSDDGALLKSWIFRAVLAAFAGFRIGGRRQVEVTSHAVRTFFDTHLKGAGGRMQPLTMSAFPEIVVLP